MSKGASSKGRVSTSIGHIPQRRLQRLVSSSMYLSVPSRSPFFPRLICGLTPKGSDPSPRRLEAGHRGEDGKGVRRVEEDHRPRVALVRAAAEARPLFVDECPRGRRTPDPREVVARLAHVAERRADELAPVDRPVLGQYELALAGVAETLEAAAPRLPRDVLEAPAVDLAARPGPRPAPARTGLFGGVAGVDLSREPLVKVDVESVLQARVVRFAADQTERVMARPVPVPHELGELLDLSLVVTHENGRDAHSEVRRRSRELEEGFEARERAVVETGDRPDAVVEFPKPVDRHRHAEREVRRDGADTGGNRGDLGGGESVRRHSHAQDAAPLEVDADDFREIAPQERLPARDQQETDRGQRLDEPLDLVERELVRARVDRIEAVRAP